MFRIIIFSLLFSFSSNLYSEEDKCINENLQRFNKMLSLFQADLQNERSLSIKDSEIISKSYYLLSIVFYMPKFFSTDDSEQLYRKIEKLNYYLNKGYKPEQLIGERLNTLLFELAGILDIQIKEIKSNNLQMKDKKLKSGKMIVNLEKVNLPDGNYLKRVWDEQCTPFYGVFNKENELLSRIIIFETTAGNENQGSNFTNKDEE